MNQAAPLAAIDVGSNTVHLAVAQVGPKGSLKHLDDRLAMVRLGADISALGRIGEERMARCVAAVREQAERARTLGARVILGIATEGVRAAANGAELIARVRAETGVALELVTGEQEAALTFWGATSGLRQGVGSRAVVDLGGGSMEIVVGQCSRLLWRTSLPLGSGAIHDQYAPSDPPTEQELAAARTAVRAMLARIEPPVVAEPPVAVGGTATTLSRLAALLRRTRWRGQAPARSSLRRETLTAVELARLLELFVSQPAREISARYGVDPDRAPLLGAGSVVLQEALACLGADTFIISMRGVREGAIVAYARTGDGWLDAATRGMGW